jgi:hypothetical protein
VPGLQRGWGVCVCVGGGAAHASATCLHPLETPLPRKPAAQPCDDVCPSLPQAHTVMCACLHARVSDMHLSIRSHQLL